MTQDTLYLLVTCTMEETRFQVLKKCVENINCNFSDHNINNDFLVFDNCSSQKGHDEFLTNNFKNVYKSKKNVGLWSGINWVLKNYKSKMNREYKNICLIESDLIFYRTDQLRNIELFLDSEESSNVGCVRIKEYSVKDNHLFDKSKVNPRMKTYRSRCSHVNYMTKNRVTYEETSFKNIYNTNFHSLICAFNRIDFLKSIFENLAKYEKVFIEGDFYREAYQIKEKCAVLDEGCFYELSADINRNNPGSIYIESSYTDVAKLKELGYVETRLNNRITSQFKVEKLNEQ